MYYLLFICECREAEIRRLFKQIIINNAALELTSKLYYTESHYMQYLEGDKKIIQNLFEIIKGYQHNRGVRLIADGDLEERFTHNPCAYKYISNDKLQSLNVADLEAFSQNRMFTDIENYLAPLENLIEATKI